MDLGEEVPAKFSWLGEMEALEDENGRRSSQMQHWRNSSDVILPYRC